MPMTAQETLILEMINRARLDPDGEAARLGISLNEGLAPGTISSASKQPLAPSAKLVSSARGHSAFMLSVDKFAHEGIGDGTPASRMTNAGYVFSGSWARGENIAFNGTTAAVDETSYAIKNENNLFVDSGIAGRGHRLALMNDTYSEIGVGESVGVYTSGGVNYNAVMLTQDFAKSGTNVFVTGVAINDANANNFYDVGEGRGNIAVTVKSGATLLGSGLSEAAGSYVASLAAPSSGPVNVCFSGGGLASSVNVSLANVTQNVKVDLVDNGKIISSATSTAMGMGCFKLALLGNFDSQGWGNNANNIMTGSKGNNLLNGGGGDDYLNGGAGNDTLNGAAGADVMTGGAGNDIFRFTLASESGPSATLRDKITDFSKSGAMGIDRIEVLFMDAIAGTAANEAFSFLAAKGAAFTAAGQLHWFQQDLAGTANDKTIIEGNVDANLTTAEFQIELTGLVSLAATDFIL